MIVDLPTPSPPRQPITLQGLVLGIAVILSKQNCPNQWEITHLQSYIRTFILPEINLIRLSISNGSSAFARGRVGVFGRAGC